MRGLLQTEGLWERATGSQSAVPRPAKLMMLFNGRQTMSYFPYKGFSREELGYQVAKGRK